MSLPFVILNHAVSANDIAIVSDNARAPEHPQSSFMMMDSPPLVRAATWPRERTCRRNSSPPPPSCRLRNGAKDTSSEKGTDNRHDKAIMPTLKLIDVYKSHANVSQGRKADLVHRPRQGCIPSTNATRILSEVLLESTP